MIPFLTAAEREEENKRIEELKKKIGFGAADCCGYCTHSEYGQDDHWCKEHKMYVSASDICKDFK